MKTKLISLLVMALMAVQSYSKDPVLKASIMSQDLPKLRELLDAGADPNEMNSSSPAIYWAATMGNVDMIKLLVEKGAKVDGVGVLMGLTALSGLVDGAKEPDELVAYNKKVNTSLLKRVKGDTAKVSKWLAHEDIKRFSPVADKIKCLIELGADPNFKLGTGSVKIGTPFLNAVKAQKLEFVKIMLDSKRVDTEYRFDEWLEGTMKMVSILEAGKYDNKKAAIDWATIPKYNTPLLFAIEKQNLELVKILVEGGANINMGKKVETKYWEFWYPLDVAMKDKKPNKEIIEYLISKGAQESKLKHVD